MSTLAVFNQVKQINRIQLGVPLILVLLLAMIVLPLPPILLDILFTFNISLSMVIVLASVYTQRPLEFSVFPTILLVATLLRLALNIASTRVVLLRGHEGSDAAGQVIEAFGEVVIGGNYAVGLVVFSILVIINFIVVTKGAGRISEVSARFTLDAMPGKQMAVDADLNAGIISNEEAKTRRAEIVQEADFYGSMDGSSKFVRGDAIAGLLILFINIIGGVLIGMTQHQLSFANAAEIYALLTIGDGLVAQIPSLMLSTAAAIMVTRVTSSVDMSKQILGQLFNNPKILAVTAGVIGLLGLIPGMPHFAFLSLAGLAGAGAYAIYTKQFLEAVESQTKPKTEFESTPKELTWEDVDMLDVISLEIGYRLINLVDQNSSEALMHRIKGVRKKLSQEVGFLIPAVHVRDNLELPPSAYKITLLGVNFGQAEVHPDKYLAINPGNVLGTVDGIATRDPSFGLPAIWIPENLREQAQSYGYTVVDASTVIATHLNQILLTQAAELFGHEQAQKLLDKLKDSAPKLVEALTPNALPLSTIVKVLQGLLEERVPLVDMRTIAEALIEGAGDSQKANDLISKVRVALKRLIIQQITSVHSFDVSTLDPSLEQILLQSIQTGSEAQLSLEPGLSEQLMQAIAEYEKHQTVKQMPAVILVAPALRHLIAKLTKSISRTCFVLSYHEIPDDKQIKVTYVLGQSK